MDHHTTSAEKKTALFAQKRRHFAHEKMSIPCADFFQAEIRPSSGKRNKKFIFPLKSR